MTIKMKILLPMIALIIVVAGAILFSNILQFSDYVDSTLTERINAASGVAANELRRLKSESNTASLYMSEDPEIAKAIESGNRDALLSRAKQLQSETGVEFCTVLDAAGTVLVRAHEPDNYGDSLASQDNIKSALSGQSLTTIEKGSAVRLSVRSGSPIYDSQDRLLGVVSAGYRLDTNTFVDSIKSLLGCEVTVFLGDERVSTTVTKADGTRAVGTKAAANVSETVLAGNTYSGQAKILDRDALTIYTPISGSDNDVLGMLFVGRYLDEKTNMVWSFLQMGLLITLILLAVSIPVILVIARRIASPIKSMVAAAHALAAGDTGISVQVNTKDEMRDLANAFNDMIENTQKQIHTIESIAAGDLTVSVEARSDKDMMNHALVSMLGLNNDVFSHIVESANQVSAGAHQLAESSQSLAEGATEQSDTVQQLSVAIGQVDSKTKDSAAMAEEAAVLAKKIKGNAEKGSEQMERMVQAVKEINDASHSINKIIKVIDDIAFQTNILALNAAVEAARAGQHGKGFAVVAEEVRNLAAKSAEAAKDTGSLIENSMAKAQLGAHIADETSMSLDEIVSGINESGRIVGEIAKASERQSSAITEINDGINQVTQVVQQNSATAQESAAASEEMSGQAALLQDLVSRFRLKSNSAIGAPPSPSLLEPAQNTTYALTQGPEDDFGKY